MVRRDLEDNDFKLASKSMNPSRSLGEEAKALVHHFQLSSLNDDFIIEETTLQAHRPYLNTDGSGRVASFVEPTGVFNTAELLINQVGLTPGHEQNGKGLFLKLNCFAEAALDAPFNWHEVRATNTITGEASSIH